MTNTKNVFRDELWNELSSRIREQSREFVYKLFLEGGHPPMKNPDKNAQELLRCALAGDDTCIEDLAEIMDRMNEQVAVLHKRIDGLVEARKEDKEALKELERRVRKSLGKYFME